MKVNRPDPWGEWLRYLDKLSWAAGVTKNEQAWDAFLRAGSLNIEALAARDEVEKRIRAAGGRVVPRDLGRQLQRAYDYVKAEASGDRPMTSVVTKSSYSAGDLMTFASSSPELTWEDVAARSPVDPAGVTSCDFLEAVFKPEEYVAITSRLNDPGRPYRVGSRADWVNGMKSEDGIFYLSNPVDGQVRKNADGNWSLRSETNLTDFRHMVLECDKPDSLVWIRAMAQVPLPIASITSSGGKSIHLLVRWGSSTKAAFMEDLDIVKPGLVRYGADPQAMTAVRLTRLPGGMRGDRKQKLLFLDPKAEALPVVTRPLRNKHK
jgi:hypothetical protein